MPVTHCQNSYRVVLDTGGGGGGGGGDLFGRVVYSGDCRPSTHYDVARGVGENGVDLPIHEVCSRTGWNRRR